MVLFHAVRRVTAPHWLAQNAFPLRRRQRKRRREYLDRLLAPGADRHHQRFLLDPDRQSHLVTIGHDRLDEWRRQPSSEPALVDRRLRTWANDFA